jgi:hypothetical protein
MGFWPIRKRRGYERLNTSSKTQPYGIEWEYPVAGR